MKLGIFAISFLLVIASLAFSQEEAPQFPHMFYGSASVDGADLLAGSVIIAKNASGVEKGRFTTTAAGSYGGPSASDGKLLVQGDIKDGAQIEFYVSRVKANEVANYDSGKIENKNLTWNFPAVVEINQSSIVNEPLTCVPGSATSASVSGATINISCANATSGTINNISSLGSGFLVGAPAPSGVTNVSEVFEISVSGNLTITVTISYNDAGIDESTITVYKFSGGVWTAIPASDIISIDTVANKITFKVAPGGTPYTTFGSAPSPSGGAGAAAAGGGGGAVQLSLSISAPDSVSIQAGASGNFNAVVTGTNNPAPSTTVTVSGLPAGFTSSVSPSFINIPENSTGTFTVTVFVPLNESPRTITLTLRAQSGASSATRNVDLIVPSPFAPIAPAPTPAPTPVPTPPAPTPAPTGITGLITGLGTGISQNPAAAAAVLIIAYAGWRAWKQSRRGGKPSEIKTKKVKVK